MKDPFYRDKGFMNKLLRLTLPITFQSLMLAMVAACDALMLGSVEQNAMSAVSLATQIQFVQNMFVLAVTEVMAILGAQYWGKEDKATLNRVFAMTLRLAEGISVLFFVLCILCPRLLMQLYTNEPALIEIGVRYLQIAGWSYLLTGISQSYLTLLKVSDHTGATALISSSAVVINIVLNAVFIYGLFGLPAMGVEGAAYATLIARSIEAVWAVAMSFKKGYLRLKLSNLWYYQRELSRSFIRCFVPILGAMLLWTLGFTAYSAFIGHMGEDAAGASAVAAVIRDLVCCMNAGLATGGSIIVGNELGAGQLEKGRLYGQRIYIIAYICGFASSALMLVATPITMLFVKLTPMAEHYLVQMMLIMVVYMFGRAWNTVVISGIFAAGGDTAFDMYSLAVSMWCIAVPLAALGTFVFHWPVWIVYACTCLDEVGKIPWVMYHYHRYLWVRDLTRQ